ncbi:hypothetical protein V496_07420 [Pseudogymnoascus sp. VKM F-4515 (FW-2607)]|nr:hypothetical protein V496_07420 [Pseudogymnoascus sp. VKM F-4515 (FW-2607)]KFY99269.1 hypothetical protein V498_00882 [Pseudogymnoascus sp. VKM F-4517 (FW-2822)]
MGDWKLRSLEGLDSWDGKCLWYKTRPIGGRYQRCSRDLKKNYWERKQALDDIRKLLNRGGRPERGTLIALARSMLCLNHFNNINDESLCSLWIEQWRKDNVSDDSSDEELSDDDSEDSSDEEIFDDNGGDNGLDVEGDAQVSQPTGDFDDSAYFSDDGGDFSVPSDGPHSGSDFEEFSPTPSQDESPNHTRHYRPYKVLDSYEISKLLRTTLTRPLTCTEVSYRTIYGFREAAGSPYLKIGSTNDFARRRGELFRECGIKCEEIAFQLEARHGAKVERLVQRHLAAERRAEDVSALEGEKRCSHLTHIEWFEVENERAMEVVKGWARFMELEPIGEDVYGEAWGLKLEWRRRLGDVGEDVQGFSEEGDKWLRWLERYAPEESPEADVEIEETSIPETEPEEAAEEAMEIDEVLDGADFNRAITDDSTPPQLQQPTRPEQTYTADYITMSTTPCPLPTSSELLHPNLLIRLLIHFIQIIFFLVIVGNISYRQYASIALFGIFTLVIRQEKGVMLGENRKHDVGLPLGVWYPG